MGHAADVHRAHPPDDGAHALHTFTSVFSYAGMPYDEAERNLRLFAREVLPALRQERAVAAG